MTAALCVRVTIYLGYPNNEVHIYVEFCDEYMQSTEIFHLDTQIEFSTPRQIERSRWLCAIREIYLSL